MKRQRLLPCRVATKRSSRSAIAAAASNCGAVTSGLGWRSFGLRFEILHPPQAHLAIAAGACQDHGRMRRCKGAAEGQLVRSPKASWSEGLLRKWSERRERTLVCSLGGFHSTRPAISKAYDSFGNPSGIGKPDFSRSVGPGRLRAAGLLRQ